jgi:hypothetical protein
MKSVYEIKDLDSPRKENLKTETEEGRLGALRSVLAPEFRFFEEGQPRRSKSKQLPKLAVQLYGVSYRRIKEGSVQLPLIGKGQGTLVVGQDEGGRKKKGYLRKISGMEFKKRHWMGKGKVGIEENGDMRVRGVKREIESKR